MTATARSTYQRAAAILCAVLLPFSMGFAQNLDGSAAGPPPGLLAAQQSAPLLSPDQLNDLVAPIALYPDPLLGQVLAASTYPLEIVEAQQWLQHNGNLQGAQLVDAAKQQNWDPSVQALVAFPDAFRLLASNIQWTTSLGNAFLAQQADVMSAVQRMRAQAQANGRLNSTPQQVVTTEAQNGQNAIQIQPADPQVVYVPVYQPQYVWGPPVWGAYPDLWYPPGFGFGFGFGPGIYMSAFFPGWGGWGGWGWGCGWFGNGLFVNVGFFNRYGFSRYGFGGGFGGGYGGRMAWAHNPGHRMGVPYSSQAVASRYNSSRFNGASRTGSQFGGNRSQFNGTRSSGGQYSSQVSGGNRGFQSSNRGTNNYTSSYRQSPSQSYRGYSSTGNYGSGSSYNRSSGSSYARSYGASPNRSYGYSNSAPRAMSAPRSSGGSSSFSGGRSSNFSGGGSHGRSSGGGGHASSGKGGHASSGGGHAHGGGGGRR